MLVKIIKAICPPVIFRQFSKIWHARKSPSFVGNYRSWNDAKQDSSGYDAENIFEIVKAAALKVKHGGALFERDSVCFYEADHRYPALASLLYIALKNNGQLNVMDFGGSLASYYFQHIKVLESIDKLHWGIVEQAHFVEWGKKHLTTQSLKFYNTPLEFSAEGQPDVIFLSSVLQYLETPYTILEQLLDLNVEYILFDRTAFIAGDKDRLTVQTVPESIYKAKYPAWFLSWSKFHAVVTKAGYEITWEFPGIDSSDIGFYKGFLLHRKNKFNVHNSVEIG